MVQAVHDVALFIVGRQREEKSLRASSPRCVRFSIDPGVAGGVLWGVAFTKKETPWPGGFQTAVAGGLQELSNQIVVARGAAFAQHQRGGIRYSRALLVAVGGAEPLLVDLRVGAETVRQFAQDRREARGVPCFDVELVEP